MGIDTIHTTISVGAEKAFDLLHISDTHLCLADDRNDQRKINLATNRKRSFPLAETMLEFTTQQAKTTGFPIVHTGDLIDFVSYKNLDAAKQFTDENDVFMAAGNHEFSLYVGEAFEDAAYRNQSLSLVQNSFRNDIRFASRIINRVNLVALDNSYYLIDEEQLGQLQTELAKGFPVILFMHTPLYSEALYDYMTNTKKSECAYLMNAPAAVTDRYNDYRRRQQTGDDVTQQAYELIVNHKNVKAIIAGHLHFNYDDFSIPDIPQFVTGCTTLRHLHIE